MSLNVGLCVFSIENFSFAINPLISLPENPRDSKLFTEKELRQYYHDHAFGLIVDPKERPWNSNGRDVLRLVDKPLPQFVPFSLLHAGNFSHWTMQNWFELDIDVFMQKYAPNPSSDFLDAKRAFYSRLDFDNKLMRHERPYAYLSSWEELFHPPIKMPNKNLDFYNKNFKDFSRYDGDLSHPYFNVEFQKKLDQLDPKPENNTELTFGNQLDLLSNGSSYPAKLKLVKSAKKNIWIALMLMNCDRNTIHIIDELINKYQKDKVDVRVIVEDLYDGIIDGYCARKMRKAKIPLFTIGYYMDSPRYQGVMHNKYLIRDGEEAILGGENLLAFQGVSNGFNGLNRDADLRVVGPAVTDLELQFVRLWTQVSNIDAAINISRTWNHSDGPIPSFEQDPVLYWRNTPRQDKIMFKHDIENKMAAQRKAGVRGQEHYKTWLQDPQKNMNGVCRVLAQFPKKDYEMESPLAPTYIQYVTHARSSLLFTTPNIDFDLGDHRFNDELHRQIIEAAQKRNVKVEYISNGYGGGEGEASMWLDKQLKSIRKSIKKIELIEAKHQLTNHIDIFMWFRKQWRGILTNGSEKFHIKAATSWRSFLLPLSQASPENIRVWTYFQYIHAKQGLYDFLATSVGSYNLDYNSAHTNHESSIFCLDKNLRNQMVEQMNLDLINSIPLGLVKK